VAPLRGLRRARGGGGAGGRPDETTNSAGTDSKTYTVAVAAAAVAPSITAGSLPAATVGTAYSATVTTTGYWADHVHRVFGSSARRAGFGSVHRGGVGDPDFRGLCDVHCHRDEQCRDRLEGLHHRHNGCGHHKDGCCCPCSAIHRIRRSALGRWWSPDIACRCRAARQVQLVVDVLLEIERND
jgi:hypothetical protein